MQSEAGNGARASLALGTCPPEIPLLDYRTCKAKGSKAKPKGLHGAHAVRDGAGPFVKAPSVSVARAANAENEKILTPAPEQRNTQDTGYN